jgi:hypothetical protein
MLKEPGKARRNYGRFTSPGGITLAGLSRLEEVILFHCGRTNQRRH